MVLEFPYFQSGVRGTHAARSGGTLELAYLCGRVSTVWEFYITAVFHATKMSLRPAFLVKFCEWNGQLTKEITCRRCEEHFSLKVENASGVENNFVDAVMMGKWFTEAKVNILVTKGHDGSERVDL
jgi:hypothetical protein